MPDSGAISLGGGGGGGGIDQLTGDVTAGPGTGSQAATLAAVGTAGTVGDAGHYPVITTDAKGRVTALTAQAVPADVPLATVTTAGDLIVASGAGAVTRLPIGANGDVLTVAAGALGYAAPAGGGPDLLQFFATTLPSNSSWAAIAYGGGAFVAVSNNSTAACYSTDGGLTWTASVTPNATGYNAIAYGGGAFVAVAAGSTAACYSTDGGLTWTASTTPSANGYNTIAYGGGAFVAVSNGYNTSTHSTNGGVSWTAATLPNAGGYAAIAYGGTAFVAVSGASTAGAYSTNGGVSWTAVVTPFASGCLNIASGGGTFVIIENVVGLNAAYSTNNGVAWTLGTALTQPSTGTSTFHQFQSIAYGNGTFVAFALSTNAAVFSTDGGATWQTATAPTGTPQGGYNAMTFGGGAFVGVSGNTAGGAFSKIASITGPASPSLSNPVVTSGTPFQPSATTNSTVYFQVDAAAAGTYTLTMGPSTAGTDYTVASAVKMVAGSDALVTLVVPMGWNVVLTLTTVTLGSTFVVAM